MRLDDVLERNRSFVAGRAPDPFPPCEPFALAVVACYDPRLDPLLLPALGLKQGEAFLFRSAGALVRPEGQTMRSLGMAVFMFGVTEILVVGHTSCRMASFETSAFVDSFRARGVPRDAFGPTDLREWAGAIASPRRGVEISVTAILDAPFLPRDVLVSGAVMDDTSGALDAVVRAGERPSLSAPTTVEDAPPETSEAPAVAEPHEHDDAHQDAGQTAQTYPLIEAARDFADTLGRQTKWRHEVKSLGQSLGRNTSPMTKFLVLEKLAERAGADSREVAEAFERLKHEAGLTGRLDREAIVRILQRVLGPS